MTTTALNLELRNIKHMESLSEETNCYTATVYLDGHPVCTVSNRGHGGCDEQYWLEPSERARVEAYFKSLPMRDTGMVLDGKPFMMQPDLEGWCGDQLTAWLIQRDYKRTLSRKVVTTDGVTEWSWKIKPADLAKPYKGTTLRAYVLAQRAGTRIVNDMTPAELADHIKAMIAAEKKVAA